MATVILSLKLTPNVNYHWNMATLYWSFKVVLEIHWSGDYDWNEIRFKMVLENDQPSIN